MSVYDYFRESGTINNNIMSYDFPEYRLSIKYLSNRSVEVSGTMLTLANYLYYKAASPAYCGYSMDGSGLPYPSADIAFDETPNQGMVHTGLGGSFKFQIRTPASYYIEGGSILVPPTIYITPVNSYGIKVGDERNIVIGPSLSHRYLTTPPQRRLSDGPMFYHNRRHNIDGRPRTQYEILMASRYDCSAGTGNASDFWRTKPAK